MSKKKKEKVVWYDDNSTVSDMSNVGRGVEKKKSTQLSQPKRYSTARDKWNTYWSAVKMMFLPMCIALTVIVILYILLMLIAK